MFKRSYSELRRYHDFMDRFEYLKIGGRVGDSTFGFERYLNQGFYTSREWRNARHAVISRDLGCDLGVEDYEIHDSPIIHHMNPLTVEDIEEGNPEMIDPEYLITVSLRTHNAIHFGDANLLPKPYIPRRPGDTKLW